MSKLVNIFLVATFTCSFNAIAFSNKELGSSNLENNNIDHSIWEGLLKKYVSENGNVNYNGFKKDANLLNSYIDYLSTKVPSMNSTKQEVLAFWINAYNALTVDLIIRNYPVKSIKDIKNPWGKRLWKLGDKMYDLEEIEHEILRKMNEPRIHFAINCASKSCPKLMNAAYTSENVEALMEQAAKTFINDSEKNNISKEIVKLSKIFDWYKKDFTNNGSLIDYINQYSNVKIDSKAKITYLEYDWSLNEQY